nr:hypothetical protein [Tanacetum cinerariifolium]
TGIDLPRSLSSNLGKLGLGRRIDDIDADEDITLVNVQADAKMFDANKDLGGILVEEPVKSKKKDQIRLDEEAALKLQDEFDEE